MLKIDSSNVIMLMKVYFTEKVAIVDGVYLPIIELIASLPTPHT
jgi:hypothetical protein